MNGRLAIGVLLALAAVPSRARADWDPKHWEYLREISPVPAGHVRVELDRAAYGHASQSFADIRVLDAGDAEMPYVLRREVGGAKSVDVPATLLNNGQEGSDAVFLLDLGDRAELPDPERIHNRLTLDLEGTDYVRRVIIEVNDSSKDWRRLSSDGLVFNYRLEGRVVSESSVSYPDSDARYVRVRLLGGEGPVPRVRGAHVKRATQTPGEERHYAATSVSRNAVGRATEFVFDLGTPGAPADWLVFASGSAPFMRDVQVGFADSLENLRAGQYRGELVEVRSGTLILSRERIETPDARGRFLKLRVNDGDDRPIDVTGIEVFYHPHVVITGAQGRPHRLAYGNPKASRPQYDLARQIEATRPGVDVTATLGPEMLNPRYEPERLPWTERLSWLPGVAVGLGALALGLVLWRSLRAPPSAAD